MGYSEGGPAVQLLLAEDDPANRYAAAQYLRRRGYDVAETEDGPGVLEALARRPVDLLLLDLGLPGLDGLDVLTTVRADNNVPVIICSARGSETDRIRGLDMGADDYLAKPFSLPEL